MRLTWFSRLLQQMCGCAETCFGWQSDTCSCEWLFKFEARVTRLKPNGGNVWTDCVNKKGLISTVVYGTGADEQCNV